MFTKLIFILVIILVLEYFCSVISLIFCAVSTYIIIKDTKDFNNFKRVYYLQNIWSVLSPLFYAWKKIFSWLKSFCCFTEKCSIKSNKFAHYHCGEKACLEQEIDVLVLNISQYYLHSWYDKVGDDVEFILLLNTFIKNTIRNLCTEITKLDGKKVTSSLLQVYFHYFAHFQDLKKSKDLNPDNFEMKHWALQDNVTEWCYLQSCVSVLIDTFAPQNIQDSIYSKHRPILHNFIVEILTEHILHPLSNLLTNPTQLNSWLLYILEQYVDTDKISLDELELEVEKIFESRPQIFLETVDDSSFSTENTENYNQSSNMPENIDSVDETENEKNFDHVVQKDASIRIPTFVSSGIKSSSNINLHDNDFSRIRECHSNACSSFSCDNLTIKRSKSADFIRQMPQLRALNIKDCNILIQGENHKMIVVLKSDSNPNNFVEQAEEAVEVPTLFSDIKITDTIQQNEVGLLMPYTLYCIQYSGIFQDTSKSSDVPVLVKQVVNIRRRFREFVALQSRLEDNSALKNYLKGIKGPSKWLVLPFSNLDKKNIAERKAFLENYLKELCSQSPIAHSSELQEFLAYGGDATTSFVKKAADISVPRIDKMLVRGVRGAIDMFRTALPNPAVEGSVDNGDEEPISDYKFPEHHLEFSSRNPEMRIYLEKYLKQFNTTSHGSNNNALEKCCQRISLIRCLYKFKGGKSCGCSNFLDLNDQNCENPVGIMIVDLIIESLKASHVNNARLFTIMKALIAPEIERYASILNKCSEDHLAIFLHALHKVLWPDESQESMNESTNPVETVCNSYARLKCYLKVYLCQSSIILKFNWLQNLMLQRIYLFLSSIQQQQLNRYLLYYIFDIIIDIMCSKEN